MYGDYLRQFKVTSIGDAAFDALRAGEVHSVFERTFNILFGDELVGVARSDVTRSPINLVTDIPPSRSMSSLGILKGMPVSKIDDRLLVGEVLEISLKDAEIWQPKIRVEGHPTLKHVEKNLKNLEKFAANNGRRGGLGQLLSHIDEISAGKKPSASNLNRVAKATLPHLVNLFKAMKSGDIDEIKKISRNLVGLGPGLSPSADDALTGLMVALWWSTGSLGGDIGRVKKINEAIISHADKTTLLSQQLLKHAARGDKDSWWPKRLLGVVACFDGQATAKPFALEIHVLRIGEAALATSPFELFLDYGLQIKARSAAAQTITLQLTGGLGFYLPTERAVNGGGYGANPASAEVGPEGGRELVAQTLALIHELFPDKRQ
jgi:hypothetical protein